MDIHMFLNAQELSLQEMLDTDMKTEIDNVFGPSDSILSLSDMFVLLQDMDIHMFLNAQELSLQEMLDTDMKTEIDNVFGPSDSSLSLSDMFVLLQDMDIHMFLNAQKLSLQEMLDTDMKTEIDNVFGPSDSSLSLSDMFVLLQDMDIHMFLNAQELSLQEMLDTDMKTEIDNVFGPSDLSLSLSDLPPLDLDESLGGPADMPVWFTSSGLGLLQGHTSDSSNSNFALDLINTGAGKMVDPSSVMPHLPPAPRTPTPPPAPPLVTSFAGILPLKRANHVKRLKHLMDPEYDGHPFPKPAYSYSCLIAMALKNSSMGSLPVSEIYNFMCEHFPYFKTAPNGWKNSVRHNLSLNKCFEKIEKPIGNGNTRKGCLWAMNPSKIAKMDEEVQKWSKKDPTAIKKAMINPGLLDKSKSSIPSDLKNDNLRDNLELLERGELKHDYVGAGASWGAGSVSDPESDLDSDQVNAQDTDSDSNDFEPEEDSENMFEDQLNLGVTFASARPKELFGLMNTHPTTGPVVFSKRAKQQASIHGNYVYKPMTGSWGNVVARRKTPLLLRTGNSSLGSSLIKLEDNA